MCISNYTSIEISFGFLAGRPKTEPLRANKMRRARLFYLRGRQGKAARIKEKIRVRK